MTAQTYNTDGIKKLAQSIYGNYSENFKLSEDLTSKISRAYEGLDDKEKTTISLYFGLYGKRKSLFEIGGEFNLTFERARQLKEKSLRKMKRIVQSDNDIYLGLLPEKAYLEYTLRINKKGTILAHKYSKNIEIANEEISAFSKDFNNLEKIARENPKLNKISKVEEAKKYFSDIKNILENRDKDENKLRENMDSLNKMFFGGK